MIDDHHGDILDDWPSESQGNDAPGQKGKDQSGEQGHGPRPKSAKPGQDPSGATEGGRHDSVSPLGKLELDSHPRPEPGDGIVRPQCHGKGTNLEGPSIVLSPPVCEVCHGGDVFHPKFNALS